MEAEPGQADNLQPESGSATAAAPDLTCVSCGYDLGGTEPGGNCPECGTSLARSLRGDALRYSDLAYLRRITRGAWIMAVLPLSAIGFLLLLVLSLIAQSIFPSISDWDLNSSVVGSVLTFCILLTWPVGVWFFTSRDPEPMEHRFIPECAAISRFTAITTLTLFTVVGFYSGSIGAGLEVAMTISAFVHHQCLMYYTRHLLSRTTERHGKQATELMMWAAFIALIAYFDAHFGNRLSSWMAVSFVFSLSAVFWPLLLIAFFFALPFGLRDVVREAERGAARGR